MIQITKITPNSYLIEGLKNSNQEDVKIYLDSLHELKYKLEQQIIKDENR